MADSAAESQLAEKDHELEELRWQLQEAQDKERAPTIREIKYSDAVGN